MVESNNLGNVQNNNNTDPNQNKIEQPNPNINPENIKNPFSMVNANNNAIPESSIQDPNKIKGNNEINNNMNNPPQGNIAMDMLMNSDTYETVIKENKQDSNPINSGNVVPPENNAEKKEPELDLENIQDPLANLELNKTIEPIPGESDSNKINENNNINNENNNLGNSNFDPFSGSVDVETKIEEKKQDNFEIDDEFATGSIVYQIDSGSSIPNNKPDNNNNLENVQNNNISNENKVEQPNQNENNNQNNLNSLSDILDSNKNISEHKQEELKQINNDMNNNELKINNEDSDGKKAASTLNPFFSGSNNINPGNNINLADIIQSKPLENQQNVNQIPMVVESSKINNQNTNEQNVNNINSEQSNNTQHNEPNNNKDKNEDDEEKIDFVSKIDSFNQNENNNQNNMPLPTLNQMITGDSNNNK